MTKLLIGGHTGDLVVGWRFLEGQHIECDFRHYYIFNYNARHLTGVLNYLMR